MKKTVLITGASSGIGKASAIYFSQKGWNVAATMRNPDKETELNKLQNTKLYKLDVTNIDTLEITLNSVIKDFGKIDVLVNNAGYGAVGIFEKSTSAQVEKQFNTNVFGLMNMCRAILPHFRANKAGHIINISSIAGLAAFPFYSVYHGTKWAVEGFSESLQYEVKQFNIHVKCVEPGVIKTDFYNRSQEIFTNHNITEYDEYEKIVYSNALKMEKDAPGPEVVAKIIYKAAVSQSFRIRYPAGNMAPAIVWLRKYLPGRIFRSLTALTVERGFTKK